MEQVVMVGCVPEGVVTGGVGADENRVAGSLHLHDDSQYASRKVAGILCRNPDGKVIAYSGALLFMHVARQRTSLPFHIVLIKCITK